MPISLNREVAQIEILSCKFSSGPGASGACNFGISLCADRNFLLKLLLNLMSASGGCSLNIPGCMHYSA
jgi:hypothetical protein